MVELIKPLELTCIFSLPMEDVKSMSFSLKVFLKSDEKDMRPIWKQIRPTQRTRFKNNEVEIGEHEVPNRALSSADQIDSWTEH
ncbi:hypothetical protein NPIL_74641 [Nephila pilipes]|uniref:Uncharacterized protein n=1 Tax=Nephila pilipes TaxID=299642 RepID=A0A8X6NM57_NEPPI|nr:hypothetical protein NPIL_74641 [Nephila pilipes]